jgi:Icc-related predicted phosphoesterase
VKDFAKVSSSIHRVNFIAHTMDHQHLRLLHISDTHNMQDLIETRFPFPEADILLHTGDMTNHGSMQELVNVNKWFGSLKVNLFDYTYEDSQQKRLFERLQEEQTKQALSDADWKKRVLVKDKDGQTLDASIVNMGGDIPEEMFPLTVSLKRFKEIIVIAGNHDVHGNNGTISMKEVLTNVTVLHHETADVVLQDYGLRIYGSPWCHWMPARNPGGDGHLFDKIPENVDILMTHGPPSKVFDTAGYSQSGNHIRCHAWGSSPDLNEAIMRAKPRVHLFGHLHEQRGVWQRNSTGEYVGGVEYEAAEGRQFPTTGPPPKDWPCDLVSCNAMCNHEGHEYHATGHAAGKCIAGPARLIHATRNGNLERWQFAALQ